MNAEPSPPGCFNSLGVIVGSWALAVLGGGVPVACAVKPSSTGLPGLGGVGVGGGCGVVVVVGVGDGDGGVVPTTVFRALADGATPSSMGAPGLAGVMAVVGDGCGWAVGGAGDSVVGGLGCLGFCWYVCGWNGLYTGMPHHHCSGDCWYSGCGACLYAWAMSGGAVGIAVGGMGVTAVGGVNWGGSAILCHNHVGIS